VPSRVMIVAMGFSLRPRLDDIKAFPVEKPVYLHSFGMTGGYLILAEIPLVVNPLPMITVRGRGIMSKITPCLSS
jgi:carotenoid cleavage dioxygenase-like enzyme